MLGGGILVLKELEKRNVTCSGGQIKNAAGTGCVCPSGKILKNGTCVTKPTTPPASNNNDDDDGNGNGGCSRDEEDDCEYQELAYGTNYNCALNSNCTCVCQRKACYPNCSSNRVSVNANRAMLDDYYVNRMDTFDMKNKIYMFDKEDDYRYKALPVYADEGEPLYAYNPDGNTLPFFRTKATVGGNLKFANVVG
jgi:hypothetical protein